MAVVKKQLYVKFETLVGGTTPAYLSTGPLLGAPANEYDVLKLDGLVRGEQQVNPLDGTNTFPPFTFRAVDDSVQPGPTYFTGDAGRLMRLFYTNKAWQYQTLVSVWEGDSATNYSSFQQVYTGFLHTKNREAGDYVIELLPLPKRLENPVIFPTGSFQVATAFDSTVTRAIVLKNGVNLDPPARTNVLGGATAWTNLAAGNPTILGVNSSAGYTGSPGTVLTSPGGVCQSYTEVTVGAGAGNAKLGVCYTLYFSIPGNANTDGTNLAVRAQGYNGGSLIDTFDSGVVMISAAGYSGVKVYVGVMYVVTDPTVTKVRLTVATDDGGALTPAVITTYYSVSNTWLLGREVVDLLAWDESAQHATFAGRGGLGSVPTYHDVDEQAVRITVLAGHPNDVARRLMLSSGTAGTNGTYDPGDGLGLGAEVPLALIDSTWDSERNATDGGTAFSGYDFSKYKVMFFQSEKIPNLLEWLQLEVCKAFHANMFMTAGGLLGIHYWRSSETAGATTLTDATIKEVLDGMEVSPVEDREQQLFNKATYRMDEDPVAGCDTQGNQGGGTSKFLRERVLLEPDFGEDSTTASSAALNGVRELVIESRGLRGAYSTRFGYTYPLGGDQTCYEVVRRILTRHRFPLPCYEPTGMFSRRTLAAGDIVPVTCSLMPNPSTGVWGRSAEKMAVESTSTDYQTGDVALRLRAVSDIVPIPNTSVAAAPTAPVNADISTVRKKKNLTEVQAAQLPVWPKDYANVVWVTLAAPVAAGTTILVYAYNSATNSYPGDSALQLVGEIPAGGTQLYYCAIGNGSGTTYSWVKISARNADMVESAKNPNEQRAQHWSGAAWVNDIDGAFAHGPNRGTKLEIRQLSGSGEMITVPLGPGADR